MRWLWLGVLAGLGWVSPAFALKPYVLADKVWCQPLSVCVTRVEQKLQAAGFRILGVHTPLGLPHHAVVVVADPAFLETIRKLGGSAIVGAGIRVGVRDDGRVSYINPDYWYRAYFQKRFDQAAPQVTALALRLARALGRTGEFGGDVSAIELPKYRYMIGMEQFDTDKNELRTYPNFEAAVTTIRGNLARRVASTSKVYELILPEQRIAVFGVAMNDTEHGEGWWVKKAGPEHIAALPWEVFVVNGKVYALYARYRTALAWPTLPMGTFMRISEHPDTTYDMLSAVAGGHEMSAW